MTNFRKVAKKIVKLDWNESCCGNEANIEPIEGILREVVEEAIDEFLKEATKNWSRKYYEVANEARSAARAEALEEAAKFVETCRDKTVGGLHTYHLEDHVLADNIRALGKV